MQRKTPKQPWRLAFVPVLILLTKDTEAFSIGRTYTSCTRLLVLLDANNREASLDPTLQSKVRRRKRQARRKPVQRRPKYYWSDPSNLRSELCEFWKNCGVETVGPTIPNEVLLMHYERHDLRAAIAKNGGRNSVSELLGGAPIMPGRWNKAVAHSRELQQLLRVDASLTADRPPRCCIHVSSTTVEPNAANDKNWSHHGGRNPKGYWSLQTVIQELYEYVDKYKDQYNRPSVWMPRPSELASQGRDDLRQAMNRFGGARGICRTAGMVPYHEWYYFEGQLELLVELKRYLDEFCGGDYKCFPTVLDIQRNGYDQLHALIQYYGGRKFLTARLSMSEKIHSKINQGDDVVSRNRGGNSGGTVMMKFGSFDLIFAIRLLTFIREDHLKRNPPLQYPVLAMPTRAKLLSLADDDGWLDTKIDEFGGYENVARRLGLALFATESWSRRLP